MRGQGLDTMLMCNHLQALKEESIEEVALRGDPEKFTAIKVYKGKMLFLSKCV